MISFLDLFKWDRFVATSFVELLFWLLTAVAMLLGIAGVVGGIAQVSADPAGGLIAIAVSILGGLAGIVVARTLCEAVIMLFRVNENLMDIRDNLVAANEPHAPPPQFAAVEPVEPVRSFAEAIEQALAEPDTASLLPPVPPELDWQPPPAQSKPAEPKPAEPKPVEAKPAEAKSPETSSLEARLAEIRARREGAAASASRAPAAAPATPHPEKAPPSGGRGGFVGPAAPDVAAEPAPVAAVVASGGKPAARPAEPKRVETRKPDDGQRPDEARQPDETKAADRDFGTTAAVPVEPQVADTLEDDIARALAREAAAEKPKSG